MAATVTVTTTSTMALATRREYSVPAEARRALYEAVRWAGDDLPHELLAHVADVRFTSAANAGSATYFPCPMKEIEATSGLKALEACAAAAIADLRYRPQRRAITVDVERATCFLMSTYLSSIDGKGKTHPEVRSRLKDTDLLQAQSVLYRRLSANLYETKHAGEYFHIHGSLEATTTLNLIGLEGHRPDLTGYRQCIRTIEDHVKQFSATELETMNASKRQAGVTCLTWPEFKKTHHGQTILKQPLWNVDMLESSSPPASFNDARPSTTPPQVLSGVKVLELCRIIAGPMIGRTLAEYGADVLKVTSPHLSDVPFFQIDVNVGKHTTELNLKCPRDRQIFEELLRDVDVVINGYRPGALEKLGYGPQQILELTRGRGKGLVYVSEDCYGHQGEWAGRPGWQQIADCVSGVAWAQGKAMGLQEPVVPPFPMCDYGTGCMGAVAALTGLFKRAKYGGSYHCKVSLVQYDIFLFRLGLYSPAIQARQREVHDRAFFQLRHHDSVDEVSSRALTSMKRLHPVLFAPRYRQEVFSPAFNADVSYVRPVVEMEGLRNGFLRSTRPNGFDQASWDGWEIDEQVVNA